MTVADTGGGSVWWWLGAALAALLLTVSANAALIVEPLVADGLAARAGLRAGDRIEGWRDAGGSVRPLSSGMDLDAVQFVHAQRGPVDIVGDRGGQAQTWTLPPGEWDVAVRPEVEGTAMLAQARALLDAGDAGAAAALLEQLREETGGEPVRRAWVDLRAVELLAEGDHWSLVQPFVADLDALGEGTLGAQDYGLALLRVAGAFERHPELARSETVYRRAAAVLSQADPLLEARALERVGGLGARRGGVDDAEQTLRQALALVEGEGGGESLFVAAGVLNGLGNVAGSRGDLDTAAQRFAQVEVVLRDVGADESQLRVPLSNLGVTAAMVGDLATAQTRFAEALEISERTLGADASAPLLNNLGIVSVRRGDLAHAEHYYQRALTLNERTGNRYSYSLNLYNLADIAASRGDNEGAAGLLYQAVANLRELSPESVPLANALGALGRQLVALGDAEAAREYFEEALRIYEQSGANNLELPQVLAGLADAALLEGDVAAAEAYLVDALQRRLSTSPRSVLTADRHYELARLYLDAGDLVGAEAQVRDALAILEAAAPGSGEQARCLHLLALIERRRGDEDAALAFYARAAAALEAQGRRIGGTDRARARWNERHADIYREYLTLLLRRDDPQAAFGVLERYRARSLLALLAERDLVLDAELPAEVRAERRRLARRYDALQESLQEAGDDAEPVLARLAEVRVQRDALDQRLRRESPRLSRLSYPEPLDLEQALAALPSGTLAVSYSVHGEVTYAFVLAAGRPGVRVHTIDMGEAALRERVRRLRFLIDRGRHSPDRVHEPLTAVASELYDVLLRPVLGADPPARLLVVPDGPLHLLPFASLVERRPGRAGSPGAARYLVEAVALHQVLSITLYRELRRREPGEDDRVLVAFAGDTAGGGAAGAADAARLSGYNETPDGLPALPWAATEAERIAGLFGAEGVSLVGAGATEREVKALGEGPRFLHFATHSLISDVYPLDSALLLQPGDDGENGLLQSWEIFEQLRLQTDLVVLSACSSGLGEEAGGDGLIGLTRAFHHAGAGSVVASLWKVADRSTSMLMEEFYRAVDGGAPYDQALRAAQIAMLRGEAGRRSWWHRLLGGGAEEEARYRHPFYWGAFTLSGDFR